MKKKHLVFLQLALAIVFTACCLVAKGQSVYDDFLEDGKAWHYNCSKYNPTQGATSYNFTLFVDRDTIINGQTYKRICQDSAERFWCALRQEGQKVYVAYNGINPELLYDFSLSEGETAAVVDDEEVKVARIDTVRSGERLFRRFHLTGSQGHLKTVWVEGIGSCELLTRPFSVPGPTYCLLSCEVGGDTLFTSHDINAAPYHSIHMLGEHTAWRYNQSYYANNQPRETFMTETRFNVTGTETVSEKTYFKVAVETAAVDAGRSVEGSSSCPVVLLREQDGKVYVEKQSYLAYLASGSPELADGVVVYVTADDSDELLLYDFTLTEGDDYPMPDDVTVSKVENVTSTDGVERKLYILSNDMLILEGVGCLNCYGELIGYQSTGRVVNSGDNAELRGYFDAYYPMGESEAGVFYDYSLWNVTGMDRLKVNSSAVTQPIYDLQGRRLTGTPGRGLYIRDGKKMVIRE
ncbi:MAG: hypothetical protein IKZ48_01825 [Prevotella sp.]|nr:hypothetical protein [Prevotella sp.]